MTWFVITGRIAGDNEDTVSILQAASKDCAIAAFDPLPPHRRVASTGVSHERPCLALADLVVTESSRMRPKPLRYWGFAHVSGGAACA